MEKMMLPVSKADILEAISKSKFPKKDFESLLRQIEKLARTDTEITARFVEAQELNMLSGLISIGGDALEDAERVYD
jgi:hypothetical protein